MTYSFTFQNAAVLFQGIRLLDILPAAGEYQSILPTVQISTNWIMIKNVSFQLNGMCQSSPLILLRYQSLLLTAPVFLQTFQHQLLLLLPISVMQISLQQKTRRRYSTLLLI